MIATTIKQRLALCVGVLLAATSLTCAIAAEAGKEKDEPTDAEYAQYPAERYAGKVRLPDFEGRDREFRDFRTRIRNGMQQGPNFAGDMAFIVFGCGASCRLAYVADVRTGRVYNVPVSGENFGAAQYMGKTDSRLLAIRWEDIHSDSCYSARFVWRKQQFERLSKKRLGDRQACWE